MQLYEMISIGRVSVLLTGFPRVSVKVAVTIALMELGRIALRGTVLGECVLLVVIVTGTITG